MVKYGTIFFYRNKQKMDYTSPIINSNTILGMAMSGVSVYCKGDVECWEWD